MLRSRTRIVWEKPGHLPSLDTVLAIVRLAAAPLPIVGLVVDRLR